MTHNHDATVPPLAEPGTRLTLTSYSLQINVWTEADKMLITGAMEMISINDSAQVPQDVVCWERGW
jgi:hypothetical protein